MTAVRRDTAYRSALILTMIALPNVGRADEPRPQAVDTEHIFGFTEGADIGGKGELEIENNLVGLLGRPRRFVAFDNETDLRYGVEEHFRASFGILTDYHNVSGAAGLTFSGISSEFRRQVSNSADSPAGLTISFAPFWRRIDDTSGRPIESYSLPIGLLADTMLVPDKTLAGLNIIFSPTFTPTKQRSPQDQPLEISPAIATAIADGVFLGAEVRHITQNQDGFFTGHGLFVGPSIFVRLSPSLVVKAAWSAQIPDETTGRLDLVNFERHQVLAIVAKSF